MTERLHERVRSILSRFETPLYTSDILQLLQDDDVSVYKLKAVLWEMIEERTVRWHEQGGIVLR